MSLNNVMSRSFTGINLIMVSIVEETEPREYQDKYFMFIKAVPSVKSDTSTGRSYDHKSAITFKMNAEKAFSMSFALAQYALGKGTHYEKQFGNYAMFADGSKSQYGSNSKKSMSVNYYTNQKTGKSTISIFTAADQTKIPFFMSPYEADAFSKVLDFMAKQCLTLEIAGPGVVVKRQVSNQQSQQNNQQSFQPPQQSSQPPQQNNQQLDQSANKVANDFAGFFGDDKLPF